MSKLLALQHVNMMFHARTRFFRSVGVAALRDISISLERGETLSLVGESGSGKTTLARICLRLLDPTTGRVIFNGKDMTGAKENDLKQFRRKAQGVFQDPFSSLDPFMNVAQIVEEPLLIHHMKNHKARSELVHWALGEVKLQPAKEFASKYPHMLSGGQRQRVAIARALVLQPEMIVADEPVSMIDASSKAEILTLLQELQAQHSTSFIYITHDIATARHFSHRIAVMYLGRIVETGPTRKVIENPLHPYTRALLEAVPLPDPANRFRLRAVVVGEPPSPVHPPLGCQFHPRCSYAIAGRCELVQPRLTEVTPAHHVECHLWPGANREARLPENPHPH